MKSLFKWTKYGWFYLLLTCALLMILPITYSYVPQFISYIFDYILKPIDNPVNTLPGFVINFFNNYSGVKCAFVVGITLSVYQFLRAGLMFFNNFCKGKLGETISFEMRTQLYEHIQDLPTHYLNNVDKGDYIQRCTSDIETVKNTLTNQIPEILFIVTSLVSGCVQMSSIDYRITLVTLIIAPIIAVISVIYFKFIFKRFEKAEEKESKMTSAVEENINGVRVVKAFNNEKYEIDNFKKYNGDFREENIKINRGMALYWGFCDGMTSVQYAITVGFCIYLAKNGIVSAGNIVSCFMYVSMLVSPFKELGRVIADFGKSKVAAKRIDEILSVKNEYVENGTLKPEVKGEIEFKDVHFKFEDSEEELLKGVNFKINSGETVAIVGKTGSGKSTIASLLVRMAEYCGGSILIDGVELKDIEKHHIRNNIGIVLQDPFLYARSVYDNISIASSDIDKQKIYDAAKTASIHKDILSFNKGYETLVGEKGTTLSGGQKQRIAIARMLVLNKPVMIFDDSLSAVDTKTDLQIRNALRQENSLYTSIIITHRITTAKEADKIIVIDNGKVTNIGTHEELANTDGLYKKLWDIQGALESEFINLVNKEVA